eukprot:116039-Prorocentrum_minimum.AAC.1
MGLDGTTPMEPMVRPNKGETYYPRIINGQISPEGYDNTTVLGFGFAKSKWLYVSALQNCDASDGPSYIQPAFLDIDQLVVDTSDEEDLPVAEWDVSVSNEFGWREADMATIPDDDLSCTPRNTTGAVPPRFAETETPVVTQDLVGEFDGCGDMIYSESVNDAVANARSLDGLTMGAWFYPTDDNDCEMQP